MPIWAAIKKDVQQDRHFIKATAGQMRGFMERGPSGLEPWAIFIDGLEFKRQEAHLRARAGGHREPHSLQQSAG